MTTETQFSFGAMRAPERVLFGSGQVAALPKIAAEMGKSVLLCTDERFAATQEFAAICRELEILGRSVLVFDQTQPELPLSSVQDCLSQMDAINIDLVVGIGGGSCLDMAKLVALGKCHGRDLSAFYGENQIPSAILPVIAVPTTAGTGSEVTPVAVLADDSRDVKVGISSRYLIPKVAICDPDLTRTCPPGLTAVSGSDAMTHAIEAYTAARKPVSPTLEQDVVFVGKNSLSDHFAEEAIRLIAGALPVAVAEGSNTHARHNMLLGSLLAGLAFGVAGTSAAHAIQYPIGAATHTPHGLGVAALMPYCMAYNRPACTTEFAKIATLLGVQAASEDARADAAPGAVAALFDQVGIPETLDGLEAQRKDIPWFAERAMGAKRLIDNNPRLLSEQAITAILNSGFDGSLQLAKDS